jgi:plasmid stability protein
MEPQPASDTIPMSSITIRNLDPAVKERLRVRAAQHGHSMEAEARDIISSAVGAERPREVNLAEAIRRRFAPLAGADDLEIPPREPARDPPRFD